MQDDPTQSQIQTLIAGYVLQELGFQVASETTIPQILRRITPTGGTVFRDALLAGCNLLIKLAQLLKETGQSQNWNLVQVLLTDGDDAGSKADLMTTIKMIYAIGQLLNVKTIKIILIGVGVSGKAEQELRTIAKAGGENAEYYSVSEADIGRIFTRIQVSLGLQKRQQVVGVANQKGAALFVHEQINPFLQLSIQNYAVLFNLDVSGSMHGQKWRNVCESVDRFVANLGQTDLICCMVFNHEVKLLASMNINDELFQKQQPQKPAYTAVVVYKPSPPPPPPRKPAVQHNPPPRKVQQVAQKDSNCTCEIM